MCIRDRPGREREVNPDEEERGVDAGTLPLPLRWKSAPGLTRFPDGRFMRT